MASKVLEASLKRESRQRISARSSRISVSRSADGETSSSTVRMAPSMWRNAATQWCFLRSEEHTSELQSRGHLVCRLLLEKKNIRRIKQKQVLGRSHLTS